MGTRVNVWDKWDSLGSYLENYFPLPIFSLSTMRTSTLSLTHSYRTGCPPPGEVGDVLLRTADESEKAVSQQLVAQRKNLKKSVCQDCLDQMRGAVMIAYPAFHKLPAYDPVRMELEDREELDGK